MVPVGCHTGPMRLKEPTFVISEKLFVRASTCTHKSQIPFWGDRNQGCTAKSEQNALSFPSWGSLFVHFRPSSILSISHWIAISGGIPPIAICDGMVSLTPGMAISGGMGPLPPSPAGSPSLMAWGPHGFPRPQGSPSPAAQAAPSILLGTSLMCGILVLCLGL